MVSREAPLSRDAFAVWRRIGTRWADNDAYGHVNNAIYYGWFDTVVNAWLIEQQILNLDSGPVIGLVVATSCTYFAALSFPEEVDLGLTVEQVGTSSVTFRLGAFALDGETAAAQGRFTHVYVDRASRRPVPIPREWRTQFTALTQ